MLGRYSTMDPHLLRQLEYFLEPTNQNADMDCQQQRPFDPAANDDPSMQSFWDSAGLSVDSALGSSSSAPTNLSFESSGQTTPVAIKEPPPSPGSHQEFPQGSRPILTPRLPKSKTSHERKRTKLSTESTPFDNVDYWIQFDNEEGTPAEQDRPGLTPQRAKEPQSQQSRESSPLKENQQQQQQQPRPRLPHAHSSPSTVPAVRDSKKRSRGPKQASNRPTTVAGPCSRPIHRSFRPEDLLEDEPLDYALSEEGDMTTENFGFINLADQMSGVDFMPPSEVPPREGLYSTPLSWEKPQPGLRLDSLLSMQNPQQLNEDEQRRLIAIAMNTGPVLGGLGSDQYGQSSGSRGYVPGGGLHATLGSGVNLAALAAFGGGFGGFGGFGGLGEALGMSQITDDAPLLRPESPAVAQSSERPRASRSSTARSTGKGRAKEKGKQNHDDDDEEEDDNDGKESKVKSKSGDRTAHNDIERKYRTNLKDKIAELRDAVPALRTVQEGMVDEADDNASGKGPKVSKGTVLTKATEYINQLEKQNQTILAKHQQLSRRLAAFEQLLSQTAMPTFQMPNYSRTLFDPRAFC